MITTATKKLEAKLTQTGKAKLFVKVGRVKVDTIHIAEDRTWTDEDEGYRYTAECDDASIGCDDFDEFATDLADMARTLRNGWMDEQAGREFDAANDAVVGLLEDGRAKEVLAALKAAGLL